MAAGQHRGAVLELGGWPSRLAECAALAPFPVRRGPSDLSGSCSAKESGKSEALLPVRVIFHLKSLCILLSSSQLILMISSTTVLLS